MQKVLHAYLDNGLQRPEVIEHRIGTSVFLEFTKPIKRLDDSQTGARMSTFPFKVKILVGWDFETM